MRCPKCGYTSFDHLNSCKKCGKDLAEFKARYGIKSVLFPGQMVPGEAIADSAYDHDMADAAVAAATGAVGVAATVEDRGPGVADSDDFGFDFMGDSAEDDDLSFDELFEEAPEEEDVEETIEGPKQKAEAKGNAQAEEDFSFDLPEEDAALDDDFGFDPAAESDEEFSFDDETDLSTDSEEQEREEDPKSPFDLPESSVVEEAPVAHQDSLPADQVTEDFLAPEISEDLFATSAQLIASSVEQENYVFESFEGDAEQDTLLEKVSEVQYERLSALESPPLEEPFAQVEPAVTPSIEKIPAVTDQSLMEIAGTPAAAAPPLISRIGAFVCDSVLLSIVGISFIVAAEAAMSTENTHLFPSLETLIDLSVPYFLVLFSLAFGYFTLFYFLAGQTPGQMLAGLRVETTEGEPLTFAHAFLRSVGGLLQLLPAGLGYLVIFTSAERRGWNDRLAGTRVVDLKSMSGES